LSAGAHTQTAAAGAQAENAREENNTTLRKAHRQRRWGKKI